MTKEERLFRAKRWATLFPSAFVLGPEKRDKVVEATIESFDREVKDVPIKGMKEARKTLDPKIKQGAEQEVKGFLDFVLMAVASFLISKLLEWLWDNYATEVKRTNRKKDAGVSVDT